MATRRHSGSMQPSIPGMTPLPMKWQPWPNGGCSRHNQKSNNPSKKYVNKMLQVVNLATARTFRGSVFLSFKGLLMCSNQSKDLKPRTVPKCFLLFSCT